MDGGLLSQTRSRSQIYAWSLRPLRMQSDRTPEQRHRVGFSPRCKQSHRGFDTRFLSDRYAAEVARVLAGNGFVVHLTQGDAPTPRFRTWFAIWERSLEWLSPPRTTRRAITG